MNEGNDHSDFLPLASCLIKGALNMERFRKRRGMPGVWLAVALTVLLVTVLCGCGGERAVDFKDDPSKKVTLVWYAAGARSENTDAVLKKVNKYLQDKLNCALEIKYIEPANFGGKLEAVIMSGEQVDIVSCTDTLFPFRSNALKGTIAGMDEVVAANAPELQEILDKQAYGGARFDGKLYAFPVIRGDAVMPVVLEFGKGYPAAVPATMQSYAGWGQAVRKALPSLYPYRDAAQLLYAAADYDYLLEAGRTRAQLDPGFSAALFPGAVRMDDASCKVINQLEDAGFVKLLDDVRAACRNYSAPVGVSADSCFAGYTELSWQRRNALLAGKDKLVVPLAYRPVIHAASLYHDVLAVAATCANPGRAVKFIELLYTDAVLKNLLTFGVEGVNFKKTADSRIDRNAQQSVYIPPADGRFGNCYLQYATTDEPADVWHQTRKYDEAALVSPLAGFVPDMARLGTWSPQLMMVASKYQYDILTADDAAFAERLRQYIAELNARGLQEYLAELQKQVDGWKKLRQDAGGKMQEVRSKR